MWLQRPSGVGGMPGPPSQGVTLNTPPPAPGLPLMSPSPPAYAGPPTSANPMPPPPEAPVKPPMDPTDRDTLIRTVSGEAGSEPIAGQAAVAHVILNRFNSRRLRRLDHRHSQSARARPRRSTGLP